jgi:hypothetical protein
MGAFDGTRERTGPPGTTGKKGVDARIETTHRLGARADSATPAGGSPASPVTHCSANAGCYFIGESRWSTSTATHETTPTKDRSNAFHETG